MYENRLIAKEWEVRPVPLTDAQAFIRAHHYARGGSNTAVFTHGLFRRGENALLGVVWWLPPTRRACESVNAAEWRRVISLTRMAVDPSAPKNACSFLLARSLGEIRKDGRFVSLVTYADESQGHTGGGVSREWLDVHRPHRAVPPLAGRRGQASGASINHEPNVGRDAIAGARDGR